MIGTKEEIGETTQCGHYGGESSNQMALDLDEKGRESEKILDGNERIQRDAMLHLLSPIKMG